MHACKPYAHTKADTDALVREVMLQAAKNLKIKQVMAMVPAMFGNMLRNVQRGKMWLRWRLHPCGWLLDLWGRVCVCAQVEAPAPADVVARHLIFPVACHAWFYRLHA